MPRSCPLGEHACETGPVAMRVSLQGDSTKVVGHRPHVASLWVHLPSETLLLAQPVISSCWSCICTLVSNDRSDSCMDLPAMLACWILLTPAPACLTHMPHQCEALQLDHKRGVQQLGWVTVRAIAYAPRSLQRALTLGACISSCSDISLVRRVLCTDQCLVSCPELVCLHQRP